MENKTIYILWTSGWDSTYRMVELSRMENVTVQPVYITGIGRKSEQREIRAQNEILEALSEKPETKATILPVKYVNEKDIPIDDKITKAYDEIRKTIALGGQYNILSQYAAICPGIEIGSEGGEEGTMRMTESIRLGGGLVKSGDTYILDPEKATETGKLAFGNFSFPIIDKAEAAMLKNIKDWGYEDVMSHIWFCHTPMKNGRQCGVCRACEVKMLNHMEWLLPKDAQRRFKVKRFFWKLFGIRIANGICRRLYQRELLKEDKK
ncbi:MAG: hypothetical protein J5766_01630 [Clostridia bacterium]|nr:hypothetical protein [Clostridia bacterium]